MKLTNQDIGQVVEDAEKFFEQAGVSQKDKIKISLAMEESLLRWRDRFGSGQNFSVTKKKWFSAPKIMIRLKGEPFNPMDTKEEEETDEIFLPQRIMKSLLRYETAGSNYRYEDGYNEISFFSTKEKKPIKIPGGTVTIAILLAIVCALLSGMLPQDMQTTIMNSIVKPVESTFMKLIVAVMGPFMFVSIVASICVMSDVATLQQVGSKILKRFIALMTIMGIITVIISQMLLPVLTFGGEVGDFSIDLVIQIFLGIIPQNLFKPFAEGNIMQIVFISFLVGVCILVVENFVPETKKIVNEFNRIVIEMMDLVSKVIPLTIFLSVYQTIMTETADDVLSVWKVIFINIVAALVMGAIMLANLAIRYHVSISDFLKKISDVLLIALSTGSTSTTLSRNLEITKKDLKINPKLCDFWIPLAHSLYSPTSISPLIICVFFAANYYGQTIPFAEIFLIIFLAMQLSVAAPPVTGGIMPIFALMLQHFHLPTDLIGMLMVATVFTGNIGSALSTLIRDCELVNVSREIKMN